MQVRVGSLMCMLAGIFLASTATAQQQQLWQQGVLQPVTSVPGPDFLSTVAPSTSSQAVVPAYLSELEADHLGQCFELKEADPTGATMGFVQVVGVLSCLSPQLRPAPVLGCDPTLGMFRVVVPQLHVDAGGQAPAAVPVAYRPVNCITGMPQSLDSLDSSLLPDNPMARAAHAATGHTHVVACTNDTGSSSTMPPRPAVPLSMQRNQQSIVVKHAASNTTTVPATASSAMSPSASATTTTTTTTTTTVPIPTAATMEMPATVGSATPDSPTGSATVPPAATIERPVNIGSVKPGSMQQRRLLLGNPDLPQQRAARAPGSATPAAQPAPIPTPTGIPIPAPAAIPIPAPAGIPTPAPAPSDSSSSGSGSAGTPSAALGSPLAYDGGFQPGWSDGSYNARPFTDYTPGGISSGTALCKTLPQGGALALQWSAGSTGALFAPFVNKRGLELWAYKGNSVVAPVDVVLASNNQGDSCNPVNLSQVLPSESANGWVKYSLDLSSFGRATSPGGMLLGCGAQGVAADLARVELRNNSDQYDALICVDKVRLVS